MTVLLSLSELVTLIAGRLISAWQVYSAPWDVLRGLNVSVLILVTPLWVVSPSVRLAPLPTLPPLHWTVGVTVRFSTTVTVHVNTSSSPAVGLLSLEVVVTSGAASSGEGVRSHNSLMKSTCTSLLPSTMTIISVAVTDSILILYCDVVLGEAMTVAVNWPLSVVAIGEKEREAV